MSGVGGGQSAEIDALVESLYRLAEGYADHVTTATGAEVASDLRALAGTYRKDNRHPSATTSSTVREQRRAERVIAHVGCSVCARGVGQPCRNLHVVNDPRDRVFPHRERIDAYMAQQSNPPASTPKEGTS